MSLLCKFSFRGKSFLLNPDNVEKVRDDTGDETCLLTMKDGEELWVEGLIDEVLSVLNAGRTL